MATATTLVLKNAAAANVNYYPKVITTGVKAVYVDRTQGVIALQPSASLNFRESATARNVSGKLVFPVANPQSPMPDSCLGKFELVLPLKLSAADRNEILARTRAMVNDVIVTAAVIDGETPW